MGGDFSWMKRGAGLRRGGLARVGLHLSDEFVALGVNMAIDIGISEEDRKSIVEGLSRLLSDTYVLYLKTHNFHWNVTGPMFRTLHLMFEEQYNELALAVDLIAERIRALGFPAPGAYSSMRAFLPSRRKKVCQRRGHDQAIGRRPGGGDTHGSRHLSIAGQGQ
jgi:hypothetical protein